MFYLRAALAGALVGLGIFVAIVARIAITITAGKRWHQARELLKG